MKKVPAKQITRIANNLFTNKGASLEATPSNVRRFSMFENVGYRDPHEPYFDPNRKVMYSDARRKLENKSGDLLQKIRKAKNDDEIRDLSKELTATDAKLQEEKRELANWM